MVGRIHIARRTTIYLVLGVALLLFAALSGCSKSETEPLAPADANPFEEATVGTDSTFEIVTWNLRNFPLEGATTVGYVVDAIEAIDPDVVALQEIESGIRFQAIVDGLSGWSGYRSTSASYNLNLAILYKEAVVSVGDGDIYEIFVGETSPFPRAPLVMRCRFNGLPLVVINNHFKCCDEGVARRRAACELLQEHIATELAGERVVLVGDLNDELTDEAQENVFQVFIESPAEFSFVDLSIAEGTSDQWSFPSWPSHLDHIMITAPLFTAFADPVASVATLRLDQYLDGGLYTYRDNISDHLPVVLRLPL